ncbi:sulfate ABC transporter permease subunit CysT [Methylorubrum suomiense]|jgi:sulfate transport system permease protein|uniref:Sulfate transport system permease protein CysT n=1 Tax=Methylorubrum suomiense TaxID=144191 RepID=A0ABQ4UPE7_9HYPH|nr:MULTISPECIES: sulfate ABC transporter permease subunit CysT [Methylobacteriaceae]GJE74141.1 Sulfate transport system permease protein CysT [Methylorubrum suomiense]
MSEAPRPKRRFRQRTVIPGFGLTLGYTLTCLGVIVLLPLATLVAKAAGLGPAGIWAVATDPRVASALRVSFGVSLLAALTASIFGGIVAWVLTRYDFPGRKLADAVVDLPFALPTAVAGIALASLYAPNGAVGSQLAKIGIEAAYTPVGIFIAMVFIGLPFAVRTVQPLIAEIDKEVEEASAILGASRIATLTRVVLPPLIPAVLTGFALAFARGVGEYGSIIFIAGNLPYVSEIAPLLIVIKLSEFDYEGASAIAVIMLAISFVTLLAINLIQAWSRRRFGYV